MSITLPQAIVLSYILHRSDNISQRILETWSPQSHAVNTVHTPLIAEVIMCMPVETTSLHYHIIQQWAYWVLMFTPTSDQIALTQYLQTNNTIRTALTLALTNTKRRTS